MGAIRGVEKAWLFLGRGLGQRGRVSCWDVGWEAGIWVDEGSGDSNVESPSL